MLDWSDAWGGDEGLYSLAVTPSDAFKSLPLPWKLARRATFALDSWLEARAYEWVDAATLISEEFYRHPRAPRGLASKSYVYHSGAPLDTLLPVPSPAGARSVLKREGGAVGPGVAAIIESIPRGALVIGYIANFHLDERLLMQAFARACALRRDVHLLVAGAPLEAADPELHAATADRIHHLGRIPFEAVGAVLGAADVLALPLSDVLANRARFPHKLADYVAAGRPIVACDVGEAGRLFKRYGLGALTQANPKSFADGLMSVLGLPPQDRAAMGRAVREAAEQHFDWDRLCEGLFGFMEQRLKLEI